MKVTDKQLYMEPKLKEKLDLMIARTTGKSEQDNVFLIDGDEGTGKTTISKNISNYLKAKVISLNELAISENLVERYDTKRETSVINNTKIIMGDKIIELSKSFMETATATIPYHRIFKIIYKNKIIFERKKH